VFWTQDWYFLDLVELMTYDNGTCSHGA